MTCIPMNVRLTYTVDPSLSALLVSIYAQSTVGYRHMVIADVRFEKNRSVETISAKLPNPSKLAASQFSRSLIETECQLTRVMLLCLERDAHCID